MYDAVVVGAGPNGLVAANLLADAGWSVLVLEAQDTPGGAVRSANVVHPEFTSDLFSAFYPLAAASPVLRALQLERYGLAWRHAPAVLAHPLPDGRCVLLDRDPARTAANLEEFAAGDGDAWLLLYAQWRRVSDQLLSALFSPFPPVRAGLRLAGAAGLPGALRLARQALEPVTRTGQRWFAGAGGRLLLTGNALHSDLAANEPGSGLFGWMLAMLGQQYGFPVPAGGAGRLTDALVARLRERGGELRCGQQVTRVLLDRAGRAAGVRCADSTVVRTRHAVLADVPAPQLYGRLLEPDQLPAGLLADLAAFEWDRPVLKVNWALGAPVPWLAEAAGRAGTVHLVGGEHELARYGSDLSAGRLPARPLLLLGQMTTADPARSPAGTESAWAYTHLPHRDHSPAELAEHAALVEQSVQRYAPGFTDRILARQIQYPDGLAIGAAHLAGGSVNGGTARLHQQLFLRPTPGLGRAETVVERLYLASSAAHPGGGVHGACGANAARAALLRRGLPGRIAATALHRTARRIAGG